MGEVIHHGFGEDVEGVITIVEQYLKSGRAEVSSAAVMLMDGVMYSQVPKRIYNFFCELPFFRFFG